MSQSPRNPKEEAQRLCELHDQRIYKKGTDQIGPTAKFHTQVTVHAIIKALEITTGHCTLNELDWNEVRKDIDYWREVELEIGRL